MSVSGVSSNISSSNLMRVTDAKESKKEKKTEELTDQTAVVYEKSSQTSESKVYVRDEATIQRLKAEVERRSQSLRELVQRMLLKQGQVYTESTDIYALLREGKLEVDPETAKQAQAEIAEDGYWGVKQTSERLVSFAIALTGGDPSKADEMIAAVKKGFEEAEKTWGGKLPDICYQTLDAAIEKLEAWRDGKNEG